MTGTPHDIELSFDTPMSQLMVGLQWDEDPEKDGVFQKLMTADDDLDLSCMLLGENKAFIDLIQPGDPQGRGSKYFLQILHTGDQATGGATLDDEEIRINLRTLDTAIRHIAFFVSHKNKRPVNEVTNPFINIMDSSTHRAFLSCDLRKYPVEEHQPFAVAVLNRHEALSLTEDRWTLRPILRHTGTARLRGEQDAVIGMLGI